MKKYKVIALSLGGLNKKVYDSGDIITQVNVEASVDDLVSQGFIQPVDEPVEDKKDEDKKKNRV